ncbi:hypothetical protein JCM10213_007971 [Rhodosporidiobolus nylandii]
MAAHVPKATLYAFSPGSVWSAPAVLTAKEKGYKPEELEYRTVDLPKGENFSPAFLRINPEGHVPVLVVPYAHTVEDGIQTKFKAICGSVAVTEFLDTATLRSSTHPAPSLSPATVERASRQKEILEFIHKADVDPNMLMLSCRDEAEGKQKLEGMAGGFLKGRQEALERYAAEVGDSDSKLKEFYAKKIAENAGLLKSYEGAGAAADLHKSSTALWKSIAKTLSVLESKFEPNAVFLVGDEISLADIHVGAWLARILAVSGAQSISDIPAALRKLEENLPEGAKVGPKVSKFAEALFERDSFKEVYEGGFH